MGRNDNLPPGVSLNMIPGNRPEDEADEKFWEVLLGKLEEAGISRIIIPVGTIPPWMKIDDMLQDDDGEFVKLILMARDLGYNHGYNDGQMESYMARDDDRCAEEQDRTDG
jgi:hypothetical protein